MEQVLAQLLQTLQQQAAQQPAAVAAAVAAAMREIRGETREGHHKKKLVDVAKTQIPRFDGTNEKFDDWAFAFKRTIRSVSRTAYEMLVRVENETKVDEEDLEIEFESEDVAGHSAEIYDVLCQACQGEALTTLRSIEDMRGLEAWSKLYQKFNPRTLARAIRLVGAVTNPPKVRELKDAEVMLGKWEEMVKTLRKDFGETFSDTVKVGIVTAMMPQSVQEFVYTAVGDKIGYDATIQKIRAIVSNKVAMASGPVPMDVGGVAGTEGGDDVDEDGCEVDAVGMHVQCHNCGGWGHYKSKCPTVPPRAKGGGKGGQWGAKGAAKGAGKGQGKGKGFAGKCFRCGETGHRKNECTKVAAIEEQEYEYDIPEQCVESVWVVGEVSVNEENSWKTVGKKGRWSHKNEPQGRATRGLSKTAEAPRWCRNKFQALSEDREVEIANIAEKTMTREAELEFNEADVRKPLASARFVAKAGNGIWLEENGGYIDNLGTGERMKLRVADDVYVFDVELDDATKDVVTLDSGAGCSVWPKGRHAGTARMLPKRKGIGMVAANGTPIGHYGQRRVRFRGVKDETADFRRRM